MISNLRESICTGKVRFSVGRLIVLLLAGILPIIPVLTIAQESELQKLKNLSLEALMDIKVTSVSRKEQSLSQAAAAVFVISQEDIRRSGLTSIPEILRMVPGLHVARIDASKWAITARGFNGRYANKLLVLMDGRSVYTPLYSGVYWDVQDTVLEDIERIEVIRGPGATLWGANAVNGVINIITKTSYNTEGGFVSVAAGSEENATGTIRFGGLVGSDISYRAYVKGIQRNGGVFFDGGEAKDNWESRRIGFRVDTDPSDYDTLTIQGDLYKGSSGQNIYILPSSPPALPIPGMVLEDTADTSGGNLMLRWSREISEDSAMHLQFYFDRTERINSTLSEKRDTYDLDFQHDFVWGKKHAIIWGVGFRHTSDDIINPVASPMSLTRKQRNDRTFSLFVQDNITLQPDTLHLILGSKFEHNDYTGSEIQPSIRLTWMPDSKNTLWAAASQAVRTPSRLESDILLNSGAILFSGSPDYQSEKMTSYELGYRAKPTRDTAIDISAFYNHYDDLSTFELAGAPFPPPVPITIANKMQGKSYGLELASEWMVNENWRLKASYTWIDVDLQTDTDSTDTKSALTMDNTPEHQYQLRSQLDLPDNLEFDTSIYYVGGLPNTDISSYVRLDLRLGWNPSSDFEFSLALRNLLDEEHQEFVEFSGFSGTNGLMSTEMERSILIQMKWKF